ncbi:hypothetical protein FS749_015695 [Ceratobasidium sp. UAMH 11750]|nr:hypothetical protein FS749_015695 [Ceratobasidium sp. UAMH 11750]
MDWIGKSAWATSDWLSGNPRLDNANDDFGDAPIFRESNPISYYSGDLFPGSGIVNPAVHAAMQMRMQMWVEDMNVGVVSGSQSVVDEQSVECLLPAALARHGRPEGQSGAYAAGPRSRGRCPTQYRWRSALRPSPTLCTSLFRPTGP